MSFRMDVDTRGPVFDGRAKAAAYAYTIHAGQTVAEVAKEAVDARLDVVLRNPTPYYQTRITLDLATSGHWRVHDDMVIYGPWLEGVGSRNRTTRFKGYATFRTVFGQVAREAHDLAEDGLPPFLGRMQ